MKSATFSAADYLQFEPPRPCPLCSATEHATLSARMQFDLNCKTVICKVCGFCFVSPAPTREAYNRFYREAYASCYRKIHQGLGRIVPTESSAEKERLDTIERFRPFPGARLLEIGPGSGRFLALAAARGAQCAAIEPSAEFREELKDRGVIVLGDFLEQTETAERFDLICLFQVLEHFHDPVAAMRKIRSLLAPGGVVVLDVPNIRRPYRSLDRYFLRYVHLSYFSPNTLQHLLSMADFDTRYCHSGVDDIHSAQPLFVVAGPVADSPSVPSGSSADNWRELLAFLQRYRWRYPIFDAPRIHARQLRRNMRRFVADSVVGAVIKRIKGHVAQS